MNVRGAHALERTHRTAPAVLKATDDGWLGRRFATTGGNARQRTARSCARTSVSHDSGHTHRVAVSRVRRAPPPSPPRAAVPEGHPSIAVSLVRRSTRTCRSREVSASVSVGLGAGRMKKNDDSPSWLRCVPPRPRTPCCVLYRARSTSRTVQQRAVGSLCSNSDRSPDGRVPVHR